MKSKIKVFASFCLMVGICLLVGCGAKSEPIGKMAGVEGKVDVKPASSEAFALATVQQQVFTGDSIRTSDEAKAEIQLTSDDSRIVLSSNTYLEVRNFSEKDLRQMSGIAVYKISPQNKELKIHTPSGMATVLGTTLRIDVSDKETIVSVEEVKSASARSRATRFLSSPASSIHQPLLMTQSSISTRSNSKSFSAPVTWLRLSTRADI